MKHRKEPRVLRDPVHGFIELDDPIIQELIDTPEFQRLGRIAQLGVSFITYRGATHTRFSHSVGVMHTFRKLTTRLDETELSAEEKWIGMIAALLHDIGHGPYSHALEKTFSSLNHEELSQQIIQSDETRIKRVLRKYDSTLPDTIVNILQSRAGEGRYPKVSSLIHGQLDVDRMDYLLRDSLFTGTRYGYYDLDRICSTLQGFHNNFPFFSYKGLLAIEEYVLARHYMYWQVYFHKTTRAYEVMLQKAFKRAKVLYENGRSDIFPGHLRVVTKDTLAISDFLLLDDTDIIYAIKVWSQDSDHILRDLCQRLLQRRLFKRVLSTDEVDFMTMMQLWNSKEIHGIVQRYGLDPEYYLAQDTPRDTPYKPLSLEETEPIYVDGPKGIRNLPEYSDVIRSVEGRKQTRITWYVPADNERYEEMYKEIRRRGGLEE